MSTRKILMNKDARRRHGLIPRLRHALLAVMMFGAGGAQAQSVIMNGNYYLTHNEAGTAVNTAATTTFNPATCLWYVNNSYIQTANSNGTAFSGNTYLQGTSLTIGEASQWTQASNGNTVYYSTGGWFSRTYYLRRNGTTWQISQTNSNTGTLYAVTISDVAPIIGTLTINVPPNSLYHTGQYTFSHNSPDYRLGYTNYSFKSANHYVDADGNSITPANATVGGYTWSISDNPYATMSAGGVVTVNSLPETDEIVTVTLTATVTGGTPTVPAGTMLVASTEVTILGTLPVAPDITVSGSTATITTDAAGTTTIRYTLDGSDPTATTGTVYSGPIDLAALGTSPVTIKAITVRGENVSDVTTQAVTLTIPAPTITTDGAAGTATISSSVAGATIYYTTDGKTPTTSSSVYSGTLTGLATMTTIKAIAVKSGWNTSAVSSAQLSIPSGVSGGTVTLFDYEDHNWSYYSDPDCPIRSLNPADVQITYYGNGTGTVQTNNSDAPSTWGANATTVKVGIDADASTFIYYKTLERSNGRTASSKAEANGRCAYTTIANPFSVRPTYDSDGTSKYRGFYAWRVKTLSGGTIHSAATGGTTYAVGSIIDAETQIYFAPASEYGMKVEFEALWARAYVNTNSAGDRNLGVERNFYVITNSANSNIDAGNYPCTYTSIYPNGTTNGTTAATAVSVYKYGGFTANADSKIEYIILRNNNSTITANGHNFTIGRGVTGYNGGLCAGNLYGLSNNASTGFKFNVASGRYTNLYFCGSGNNMTAGILTSVLGCDYDRAMSDNSLLKVTSDIIAGYNGHGGSNGNEGDDFLHCTVRSGDFDLGEYGGGAQFYLSLWGNTGSGTYGKKTMIIEGGVFSDISGGIDIDDNDVAAADMVDIRMKGGTVNGVLYGAAQYAASYGNRRIVITGGDLKGWVAGGANGTQTTGGKLSGDTYVYFGGTAQCNSNGSNATMGSGNATGGNIFGAGSGNAGAAENATVGEVDQSTIVIADMAVVERNVYGGGNYGYVAGTAAENKSDIHVLGGNVQGSVFGGSNLQKGNIVNITMRDGLVKGNIYGGSNTRGTINGKATLNIMGGTVGTTTVEDWTTMAGGRHVKTDIIASDGCVFGGGYGEGTNMAQGVEINISQADDEKPTIIYNNVYGGGKLGNVSANATATNDNTVINMTGGTIHGKLFGGGSGSEDDGDKAVVEGNATIHVSGGQIDKNVYGGGELATVGIETNEATGLINVLIDGTASIGTDENCKHVYGGGYVYGAGYGIPGRPDFTFVRSTTVTIDGDAHVRGSVFGSGENGHVDENTKVYIKGNCFIGTELSDAEHEIDDNGRGVLIYRGNVYGGGRGMDVYTSAGLEHNSLTAGRVGGNTFVEVSGGTIYHDVFGGGSLATVGIATIDPSTGLANYTDTNTGNTEVHIKGGIIGYSANEEKQGFNCGFVYGGCRGLAAAPSSDAVKMAYVHNANVYIEPGANVKGSVFGGGANGHVKNDTRVEISGGSIGTPLLDYEVGFDDHGVAVSPVFRGNVYAGGRGVDLYKKAGDDVYSLTAGAVYGNATLIMTAGHVWHNVYGSGSMASVGTVEAKPSGKHVHDEIVDADGTTILNPDTEVNYLSGVFAAGTGRVEVTITGGTVGDTTPGHEGRNNGRVYGAGRGVSANRSDLVASMEYVNETYVNIGTSGQDPSTYSGSSAGELNYPYIYGAVFGGGENGHVKTDTHVNIYSGIIGYPLDEGESQQHKTSADGTSKNPRRGHVYGGGRGVDPLYHVATETRSSTAGRVYGHTYVTMTGGVVRRAIYGGGNLASVGIYRLAQSDLHIIDMIEDEEDSGDATITISGGIIGNVNPDGTALSGTSSTGLPFLAPGDNNGHVFGSSCGMVADNYIEDGVPIDLQYRQMGYSHSTHVNISGGHMFGSIFGSGENGHVWEDSRINISGGEIGSETDALIYSGNVYGSGRGVDHPHAHVSETAGKVRGNTTVNITGGTIWRDVYGGGSLASVGEADETANDSKKNITDDPLTNNPFPYSSGLCRVVIDGTATAVHGSVYGSGRGVASTSEEYRQAAYVKNTLVTIKGNAHIYQNVFGGGNAGHVRRNTNVNIIGTPTIDGNVYGAGAGNPISLTAGLVNHDVEVNINGGTIGGDVYGGGAIANSNVHDMRNDPSLYSSEEDKAKTSIYGKPAEGVTCKTKVNLIGGIIKGDAYGGGQGEIYNADNYSEYSDAQKAIIKGNCAAYVRGDVTVVLNGTAFSPDSLQDNAGKYVATKGRIFGCNNLNGSPQGKVLVIVKKTVGLDGSGNVKDYLTKPAKTEMEGTTIKGNEYEVQAVYGGGNLADYDPWSTLLTAETTGLYPNADSTNHISTHNAAGKPLQVIIEGCGETCIGYVYGGGNAAAAPSTDVLILGSYAISRVFGGGNGEDQYSLDGGSTWMDNPGADVGWKNTTHDNDPSSGSFGKVTSGTEYGTGGSRAIALGGTITMLFGGSNTRGDIRTSADVELGDENLQTCELHLGEIYGGGNEAYISGTPSMDIHCIEGVNYIYGGSRNANIAGDVVLNITGGTYKKVFGGNNIGGIISGTVTVNVEEKGCLPIKIDELYGGGNMAPYSVENIPAAKRTALATTGGSDDAYKNYPQVNVISATSVGKVFGGGLGSTAVVTGNPHVNINMQKGSVNGEYTYVAGKSPAEFASYASGYEESAGVPRVFPYKLELGTIGTVFGGGNAANVVGDTYVNIGDGTFINENGEASTVTRRSAQITGRVFGGGNNAEVSGNTHVVIGKKE